MSSEIQTKFESQLPKPEKWSFGIIFNYIAGICSVAGLVGAPFVITDPSSLSFVYIVFLSILVIVLFAYTLFIDKQKLHRYAQSVIFSHYVVHLLRDSLAEIDTPQAKQLAPTTEKMLDAIATCFSIITGKRCRCAIVDLVENTELRVATRDSISKATSKKKTDKHLLKDNTDFSNLWYALNGCSRYYLCNDLPNEWKKHKYLNSSFDKSAPPEIKTMFLGFSYVANWRLPYKSALILPIRHLTDFCPPTEQGSIEPNWNFNGFLCIDCNSVNAFDDRYAPELGGLFADALFTLFNQTAKYVESQSNKPVTN